MALITCPDCGREISDRAQSCLQCGAPLVPPPPPAGAPAPTTIQGTSKILKFHLVLASLFFWGGCASSCMMFVRERPADAMLPLFALVAGAVWFIGAKVAIWWHHD